MDLWLSPHDARVRRLRSEGTLFYGFGTSPFGDCIALTAGEHLLALRFLENREEGVSALRAEWPNLPERHSPEAEHVISRAFENPLSVHILAIGTPFQLTIWEYLRRGSEAITMTYGELARAIGRPKAARAVGRAMGSNGIAFLIPCHRVISRGKLTGYRWGLDRKKALLAWELSRRNPLRMPF
jgi:AraC family transcriptional regulator of adaptative response/methylated-DNA-[protein]-cysteine methyltransferase